MSKEEEFLEYLQQYLDRVNSILRECPDWHSNGAMSLQGEISGIENVRDKFCDVFEV